MSGTCTQRKYTVYSSIYHAFSHALSLSQKPSACFESLAPKVLPEAPDCRQQKSPEQKRMSPSKKAIASAARDKHKQAARREKYSRLTRLSRERNLGSEIRHGIAPRRSEQGHKTLCVCISCTLLQLVSAYHEQGDKQERHNSAHNFGGPASQCWCSCVGCRS